MGQFMAYNCARQHLRPEKPTLSVGEGRSQVKVQEGSRSADLVLVRDQEGSNTEEAWDVEPSEYEEGWDLAVINNTRFPCL